jgi:uncharacterized protein with FMN-binding domain
LTTGGSVRRSNDKKRNGRITHGLVALSSAAVLAVYSAGYARTRAAAERLAAEADRPRPAVHGTPDAGVSAFPEPLPITSGAPAGTPIAVASPEPGGAAPGATPHRRARRRSASSARPASTTPDATTLPAATAAAPVSIPAAPQPAAVAPVVAPAMPVAAETVKPAAEAPVDPPPAPASQYKDGTYSGWGSSRHGDIEATVVIADGRIVSAAISRCLTRYSCSWISRLPPQVVSRQSPEVDYVSGATQSTNAFYYAIVDALSKAK